MAKEINTTTLKELLASMGYSDVRTLSQKSFGVVVPKTKVDLVVPTILKELKAYNPKAVSDREVHIGGKQVYAKNANMQRTAHSFTQGRGNEWNLLNAITEYITDYGKPIDLQFVQPNGPKLLCKQVMKVSHVGAKNIFERNKADIQLITSRMVAIPISIKDENAGYWESADSLWGEKARMFLEWAMKTGGTQLVENGDGGYSVRPPIALKASAQEIRNVVFGADIYGKGAVVVKKFMPDSFKWDFDKEVLTITCKEVIKNENDIKGDHEVYFEIRNEKGRNPKYLYKGLRTMATMKSNLRGNKIYESNVRHLIKGLN